MLQVLKNLDFLDINFIVVNSKKPRSQQMLPELTSRITFPVYQDTIEDDVWKIMGGGKDDMYIYDRCGRLAFHIPFPLSIIHEDRPKVLTSLLFAYFFIPCGSTCDENNSTYQFKEAHKGSSNGLGVNNTDGIVDMNELEAVTGEEIVQTQEVDDEELSKVANESMTEHGPNLDFLNINNSSSNNNSMNDTYGDEINMLQNVLDYINGAKVSDGNKTILVTINEKIKNPFDLTNQMSENTTNHNQTESLSNQIILNETNATEGIYFNESKADKEHPHLHNGCVQEDRKVCIHWSKRRLKLAQNCCSSPTDQTLEADISKNRKNSCKNFTKKRCKKLKTIIKCCSDFVTHSENPRALNSNENKSDM